MAAEKKIGGRLFRVNQPLATEALQLQFRVANILSGSPESLPKVFGAMAMAQGGDEAERNKANAEIVSAILSIFGSMKPAEGTRLMADLVAMSQVQAGNGKYEPADLDTEFSSDPSGLYQLVGFVLKEVLGPFISGLVGSMSAGKAASLSRSET